ncbi:MAG: OmpA family protein [Planctomycetota bacterium]
MSDAKHDEHKGGHGAQGGAHGAAGGAHDAHGGGHDAHGGAHDGGHDAHGGEHGGHDAHGGGHGKHHEHDHPPGVPPWLISFGDMMTLFLCFFIVLVTMAPKQDAGLVAAGLGPFVAALENKGNDAALMGADTLAKVNTYRKRFGLAPITEDQLIGAAEIAEARDIEKLVKASLKPYAEMMHPLVAEFEPGSAELTASSKRYLDLLADTFRPGFQQILVLEGHADDAGDAFANDDAWLAASRAQAVKDYVVNEHGFIPTRVEARAWAVQVPSIKTSSRGVDARLVQPVIAPQS